MSNWKANKSDAVYFPKGPTKTDQSQAANTDINIIVTQFLKTGAIPGGKAPPMFADFSQLPTDLRGFIEMGRDIERLKKELPEPLRGIPPAELFAMTTEQINAKLKEAIDANKTKEKKDEDIRTARSTDRLLHEPIRGPGRQDDPRERRETREQRRTDQ